MARLKPPSFYNEADPRRRAELEFFKACKISLSEEWTVVHSLTYVGPRPSLGQHRGNGEADFVLLHKQFGVLVVEVKGGAINLRDGSWFSTDGRGQEHQITNPFVQAEEAAQAFHTTLRQMFGDIKASGTVRHCVAFPAVSQRNAGRISTYGPSEIIIYREDLSRLDAKIGEITQFYRLTTRWNESDFTKVNQLFYPTTKTPGMSYHEYLTVLEQLDELTESQKRTVRQLTRAPGKTVVVGGAGTGKTVLGMSRAEQLAADGKNVLFVCANSALATHLRSHVEASSFPGAGSLTVDSASNFISETARAGLRGKDYEARKERLPKREDRFIDAVLNADPPITFDCIILDEAQDIRKSDVDLFELVLRPESEGGTMLVFGDPNQQLALRRSGSALDVQQGGLKLDLDVNCRNTYEIAKVAHTFTSQPVETLETRSGIKIRSRESSDNIGDLVRHEIVAIRNEFDPHSLAILTLNGISDIADNDPFFVDGWRREMESRQEGDKDVDARVYAIQAFQGREADAVIVALSENSLLKTYPFERFFKEIEGIRPPTPRQNGVVDDLRRVWSQYERFVKRVSQELVPEYRVTLEQSEGLMSTRKIEFLVKEFERCRRREFSPDFRSPWLTEHWERQQTKSLRVALYSMMTRARVVLSIISNSNVKAFIEEKALGVSEDVTELLQDEGD